MLKRIMIAMITIFFATAANADFKYLESGFGITFEGCDYDKLVNLKNGFVWECSEYGYTYHYGSMTVIEVNGNTKLCDGDLEEAIKNYPDDDCYNGTLHKWR